MPREDISFKTEDGVRLQGHFYTPAGYALDGQNSAPRESRLRLPCLVLCHGLSCVKEQVLPTVCEAFTSSLQLACLTFDYRGFGTSDTLPGAPRQEISPHVQISDIQDAITYAQTRQDIDSTKIGLWGYSYGGGHALYLAAVDRRVKAVVGNGMITNGWDNFLRLIRIDLVSQMDQLYQEDRLGRATGKPAMTIPVVSPDPKSQCVLPSAESFAFFSAWEGKSTWKNEVTVRSTEHIRAYNLTISHIEHITPTPLMMAVATRDTNCPPDLTLKAYRMACEPKELLVEDADHYNLLDSPKVVKAEIDFLRKTLCGGQLQLEQTHRDSRIQKL